MAKSDRASDAELNNRILTVAKAILAGYTKRAFLIQYVSETYDWGVSERQIDNYISSAKELIKDTYSEEDLKLEKDIAQNRLEALFTMNMKIQDYREARNVTMDRMKLLGLLIDKQELKANVDVSDIDYSKLSDEALKEIVNAAAPSQ